MQLDPSPVAQLLREALVAPPWVTRLESPTGQVVDIEREPETEIELRLVIPSSERGDEDWLALVVRPTEVRPARYPSSVPFVPGTSAIVTRHAELIYVAWRPSVPSARDRPISEGADDIRELTERLRAIGADVRRDDPNSRAQAAERVKAVFESLDADTRARLGKAWEAMRVEPAVEAELDSIFDAVIEASRNEGWEVIEEEQKDSPVPGRKAKLKLGASARTVLLLVISGGSVVLRQELSGSTSAA